METVTFGNGGGSIGANAFEGCTALISVTFGNGAGSIGANAFDGCAALETVTLGNGLTSIGEYAFYECSSLTEIVIPGSVESIGAAAFFICTSLTSVSLGEGVQTIGRAAFAECESLTHAHIPASVTSIGSDVFGGCDALEYVCSPDPDGAAAGYCAQYNIEFRVCGLTVTLINGEGGLIAADKTEELMQGDVVTLTAVPDEGYEFIGFVVNDGNGDNVPVTGNTFIMPATSVTVSAVWKSTKCGDNAYWRIENGVLIIYGTGAMYDYNISDNLPPYNGAEFTSVIIEDGITSIGNAAFARFTSLTEAVIPDSVLSIGNDAFYACVGLTDLTIGNGVTSIGSCAFSNCFGLTAIELPDSVLSIAYAAFDSCMGLTSVTLGEGLTSIGGRAFYICDKLTEIELPDSVVSIGDEAFSECKALAYVSLGDGVTSIDFEAFYHCRSLTEVHIPASVTSIGRHAFYGCTALQYICSPDPDGAAAAYCAANNIEFRVCGLTVTVDDSITGGFVLASAIDDLMQGDVVTLLAVAIDGYEFVGLTVTDENGDPVEVTGNSFVMPASNVYVTAVFSSLWPEPMPGDVNGDGEVTFNDISVLYLFLIGMAEIDPAYLPNADFNDDLEVNFLDISELYLMLIG